MTFDEDLWWWSLMMIFDEDLSVDLWCVFQMTSGGTESIMLACRAYRELARDRGIKHPEM